MFVVCDADDFGWMLGWLDYFSFVVVLGVGSVCVFVVCLFTCVLCL